MTNASAFDKEDLRASATIADNLDKESANWAKTRWLTLFMGIILLTISVFLGQRLSALGNMAHSMISHNACTSSASTVELIECVRAELITLVLYVLFLAYGALGCCVAIFGWNKHRRTATLARLLRNYANLVNKELAQQVAEPDRKHVAQAGGIGEVD